MKEPFKIFLMLLIIKQAILKINDNGNKYSFYQMKLI